MSITNAWGFGLWLLGAMAVGGRAARPEGGPEDVRDVQEVWRRT